MTEVYYSMVRVTGLEPVRLSAADFKSAMATNYITLANKFD